MPNLTIVKNILNIVGDKRKTIKYLYDKCNDWLLDYDKKRIALSGYIIIILGGVVISIKMMHHVCIQTEKYKESLEFYTEILGFELVTETANFHERDFNTWLRLGTFMIELQTAKKGDKLKSWSSLNEGIVHMCFLVDNIQEEFDRIKKLGYTNFKIKNGEIVYKVEDGYLFKVKAPEGTEIEIRDLSI